MWVDGDSWETDNISSADRGFYTKLINIEPFPIYVGGGLPDSKTIE